MRIILAAVRTLLHLGWIYALITALGHNLTIFRDLLPLSVYIVIAIVAVALTAMVQERPVLRLPPAWRQIPGTSLLTALSTALLIALLIDAITIVFGTPINGWALLLNIIVLAALLLRAIGVATEETTYEDVVTDVRTGILLLALSALIAAVPQGLRIPHIQPLVYAAVIGYVLLSILGLALARRFAADEYLPDSRDTTLEREWFMAMGLLMGIFAIISLALVQVLSFDLASTIGGLLAPIVRVIAALIGLVIAVIIDGVSVAIAWLVHLLHLHPIHLTALHHRHVPQQSSEPPHKRLHAGPEPILLERLLEALGIIIVGSITLSLLMLAARNVSFNVGTRLRGERRVSTWSWHKVFAWLAKRSREELTHFLPHPELTIRLRPRRPTSVREVYRAFLLLARERARPKQRGETGLEYSTELSHRWPAALISLEHLNSVYMLERYGAQPPSPERLQTALDDLRAIDELSMGQGEQT